MTAPLAPLARWTALVTLCTLLSGVASAEEEDPFVKAKQSVTSFYDAVCHNSVITADPKDISAVVDASFAPKSTLRLSSSGPDPIVFEDYPEAARKGLYVPYAGIRFCAPDSGEIFSLDVNYFGEIPLKNKNSVGGFAQWQNFHVSTNTCGTAVERYVFGEYDAAGRITEMSDVLNGDGMRAIAEVLANTCDGDYSLSGVALAEQQLMEARVKTLARDVSKNGAQAAESHYAAKLFAAVNDNFKGMPPYHITISIRDVFRFASRQALATGNFVITITDDSACAGTYTLSYVFRYMFDDSFMVEDVDIYSGETARAYLEKMIACSQGEAKEEL